MEKLICRKWERCMRPQKGPHPRASGVKDPLGLSPNWQLMDTACPTQPPTARHGLPSRASCCQTGVSMGVGGRPELTEVHAVLVIPLQQGQEQLPQGCRGLPRDAAEAHRAASAWAGPQGVARLGLGHLHGH